MKKNLIDKVNDGFIYFNSGFIDDLDTDKKYYVESFMNYIEELEKKLRKLKVNNKKKQKKNRHLLIYLFILA